MASILYFLFFLISAMCTGLNADSVEDAPVFQLQPDNTFSKGHLYYRVLQLDEESNSVYVGAMNHLFRLWMFDVNDTDNRAFYAEKEWQPTSEALARCAYRSSDPNFQCQNHVRVVFRLTDNSLYTCATNAFTPIVNKLDASTLTVLETDINGAAICSVDPDDNSTAVWVDRGNPSSIPSIYSGTVTDFTQTNRIIYRPPLVNPTGEQLHPFMRTMHTDSKWLNEPSFVGSFDIGDYVYFFFRETAVEFINCGKAVYSRVARICKNDVGGRQVLKQNWATFLKARLNCSLPGEFPFYFDQIQGVYKVKVTGDSLFYATFSTTLNGFHGSAVCSFSLRAIDQVFDRGLFKEQISSTAAWLPVLPDQVPTPRPGQCVGDTQQLSDSALHFVKSHLLMDEAVGMVGQRPIFHKRDLLLSSLVVDHIKAKHGSYQAIFAGSASGQIYKILQWTDVKGAEQSQLLAIHRLPRPQPIRAMQLLKKEFIYVAQDSEVSQLNPAQCNRYQTCGTCTKDPYCSWQKALQRCHRSHESHQFMAEYVTARPDIETDGSHCDMKPKKETSVLYPGDSIHLQCRRESALSKGTSRWRKDNATLDTSTGRHFLTVDDGLVIVNISAADSGQYECLVLGQVTVSHQIFVDDVNCKKPQNAKAFQTAYREWCREFQNYKHTMDKWQQWYEQNTHCANAPNFKKLASRAENESGTKKSNRITEEER